MAYNPEIERGNARVLELLSVYLNETPAAITGEMVRELAAACALTPREAYAQLLAACCGLDAAASAADRALFRDYFLPMTQALDADAYASDPYYRNIRIPAAREGSWEFRRECLRPYEAFVFDDLRRLPDGRVLPQIGFFDRAFPYPAVLENGREWMLITPNEITTMRLAVAAARGRVLAYGLGLGYFAYMAAEKPEVESVTVVERDPNVLSLFRRHILPQFPHADKLTLVEADAFDFARTRMGAGGYDVVFTDLWHDPGDGVDLYLRMKALEKYSPGSRFLYWIEETLRCYL